LTLRCRCRCRRRCRCCRRRERISIASQVSPALRTPIKKSRPHGQLSHALSNAFISALFSAPPNRLAKSPCLFFFPILAFLRNSQIAPHLSYFLHNHTVLETGRICNLDSGETVLANSMAGAGNSRIRWCFADHAGLDCIHHLFSLRYGKMAYFRASNQATPGRPINPATNAVKGFKGSPRLHVWPTTFKPKRTSTPATQFKSNRTTVLSGLKNDLPIMNKKRIATTYPIMIRPSTSITPHLAAYPWYIVMRTGRNYDFSVLFSLH